MFGAAIHTRQRCSRWCGKAGRIPSNHGVFLVIFFQPYTISYVIPFVEVNFITIINNRWNFIRYRVIPIYYDVSNFQFDCDSFGYYDMIYTLYISSI